jgi:hypothetical protein
VIQIAWDLGVAGEVVLDAVHTLTVLYMRVIGVS